MKVVLDFIHLRKCSIMLFQSNQLRCYKTSHAMDMLTSKSIGTNTKSLDHKQNGINKESPRI